MIPKKAGKEGSKSQKRIHEDNINTLAFYRNVILCVTAIYAATTYLFFWDGFRIRYCVLSILCLIANGLAYKFMSYMSTSRSEVDERGNMQLVDAGLDLNIGPGGIGEHAKDLILACCIVQALSIAHNAFWILILFVPGRIFYMLWVHILAPWIFDPNQSPEISEKKQRKQERRMKRMQNSGR